MPRRRSHLTCAPLVVSSARSFLSIVLSFACIATLGLDLPSLAAAALFAKDKKPKLVPTLKGLPITELSPDEAILHALNRLAYGPRPGDVEAVRQMGLAKWIDRQLNPESIDDKALDARLSEYPTLKMSTARLIEDFQRPNQAEKKQEKAAQNRSDVAAAAVASKDVPDASPSPARNNEDATAVGATPESASGDSATMPPAPSMKDADDSAKRPNKREALANGDPNSFPRAVDDQSKKPQRIIAELAMAKVTRAIYSERQLQQVMDDFWFNHFNVFAGKGEDRWYLTSYERDVIAPHAFGKFKDLVRATAKSPAMLFYLDNFLSADPRAAERQAAMRAMRQGRWGRPLPPRPVQAKKNVRGLNENYGRELMELHTLGVDGGYTQKDVTEVARAFTGWTIDQPRQNPEFKFDDRLHDPDPKIVLGKKIHAGGMKDGEEVITLLARHPSTAKFISTELARRFVSDNPPPELVSRMAHTFQSTDGDIHAVMKTMIYSPEFWSRAAYRAKIKTPFELVVSSARALGTDVNMAQPLVGWVARIGEPLYQCQPPTGYSDKADAWVNTGALLNRMNFSLALAGNRMRGSRSDVASLLTVDSTSDAKAALDRAVQLFLGGQASATTVGTLVKQLDNPQIVQARLDDPVKQVDLGVVAGLVLGAPEFQRR